LEINLKFLGAARNVTGSCYCVEANGTRILVDYGLYQERDLRSRNWDKCPVPPDTIDAVLLTHAHVDHCGLLPKLVREGYQGKIYCTPATDDIAEIMLRDAARLQEEDAEYKRRRHEREGRSGPFPEVPLYTIEDAEAAIGHFSSIDCGKTLELGNGISAEFFEAGHVFGSAMIMVSVNTNGEERKILFSGDVGRWDKPILRDPTIFAAADYVIVESTYGDRLHQDPVSIKDSLADIVNSTIKASGNIVIPSFALERAQEILYYMNELLDDGSIPAIPVYLDSPMAIRITEVFKRHPELYDREMRHLVGERKSPFNFPELHTTQTADESKKINTLSSTAMIIAGSGMCTGGRIKHHLVANSTRPESTILFVGYQAVGTLGRHIVDGAQSVRILGEQYPVQAKIAQIHGLSAHADRDELFRWLSGLKKAPRHVFVTHGESEAADNFRSFLIQKTGWDVTVPDYGSLFTAN